MWKVTRSRNSISQIEKDIPKESVLDDLQDDEIDSRPDSFDSPVHYGQRDRLYTQLMSFYLKTSTEKAAKNACYKDCFFKWVIFFMFVLIVGPIVAFVVLAFKAEIGAPEISLIAGCTAGMLSSVIVLPKIIAEHLFPTNEDEHMIEMVKNMQMNDAKIRDAHGKQKERFEDKDDTRQENEPSELQKTE